MTKGPSLTVASAMFLLLFLSAVRVGSVSGQTQVGSPFQVTAFSGENEFAMNLAEANSSFIVPRDDYYLAVGGGTSTSFPTSNLTGPDGKIIGMTSSSHSIIPILFAKAGTYTLETAGDGKFMLTLDVQNPNEVLLGNISTPIALFTFPIWGRRIHLRGNDGSAYGLLRDRSVQQHAEHGILFPWNGVQFFHRRPVQRCSG